MGNQITVRKMIKRLITFAVIFASLIVGLDAVIVCTIVVKKDYKRNAETATAHLLKTLEASGSTWHYDADADTIYVGDTAVTLDLFEAINDSSEELYHTVFKKNLRILTNIKKEDGSYATGTTADEKIYNAVKNGETVIKDNVKIMGGHYTVCYMPIYSDGVFWGMMFTGVNQQTITLEIVKLIFAIGGGITFSLVVIVLIANRILKRIADGMIDRLDSGTVKLQGFSGRITDIASKTTNETDDIAKAMNNVASGATNQASATQEAMASMHDFAREIDVVNTEILGSRDILESIKTCVEDSENAITQLNNSIEDSDRMVKNISDDIDEGVEKTENATSIVKSIDDIAFQINLLALNASVEASHAGQFGLGFAVVANEIKNLAASSAQSAADTADIIKEIVETMNKTKASNKALIKCNLEQTKKAEIVAEKMDAVRANIEAIVDRLNTIRGKSEALEVVKNELVTVVQSLSATAQENAAVYEEVCASTETVGEDVMSMAESLSEIDVICNDLNGIAKFFGKE